MNERIAEYCTKFRRRTAFWRSGAGLVILAVAFVGLRLLAIQLQHPAHFKEITAAYGADSLFYDTPQVDHAGTRFTFVKTDDMGYALFLCDADTGRTERICGENGLGRLGDELDIHALPWSPDDSSFLYTITNKLMAYSPDTKQSIAMADIGINSISDLVWLNPTEFACITYGTNLCYMQQQDGQWEQRRLLSRDSQMSSLTAIGDDVVAWLEDNLVCRVNLTEGLSNSVAAASATNETTLPTNGLALWLDASTLQQPDQSRVTRLADLSRNKNDAYWNGQPPVVNGTNSLRALHGKPTIHFASLNSSTSGAGLKTRAHLGIIGSAPRSIFVVMRHNRNRSMMVSMGDTAAKGSLFSIEWTNYLYLPTGWRTDNRIKMASTNWNILEVVFDGISQKGYVNGILRGMATNRLNTADKEVEIGLRTATGGKNAKAADGDFAELLVYDRALNYIERKQVEDYLGKKWFGRKSKNVSANSSYVWFVPPVEGLKSFSYSKDNGLFLLNSAEAKYNFLWRYEPMTGDLSRIAEAASFQSEQWFGDNESAVFQRDSKRSGIVCRDSLEVEENRVLPGSNVRWFEVLPDGERMLVLEAVTNEPSAGIWGYDSAAKKLRPIVPYSDNPSVYAKDIVPFDKPIKTSWGTNLVATVFPPANFNPHKKYPLVIGDTRFVVAVNGAHGRQWVPCVAAGGAYVVIVERRSWRGGIENWGDDVMAAYNSLKKDLHIDTSQVYLFGSSAETYYMNEVLTNAPGLWEGVILLNPSELPDLSSAPLLQPRPKILISAGGDEGEDERFKKYQEDSLKSGVLVEYVIHPGEGHHIVGNAAQLERTKAIMHFIFEE